MTYSDAVTATAGRGNGTSAAHGWATIGYRARGAADVARILSRHHVTGARRVAALRTFHRTDSVRVAIPAGRLVINRKG